MSKTHFRKPNVYKARCPACNETIHIDEFLAEHGELIDCPECWTLLQIASVQPFRLVAHNLSEDDFGWE